MKLLIFEIWSEGYITSGESGDATFHGKFKGETFKDAVIAWKNSLTDTYSIECVDIDNMRFWGCRLFDNEKDARKLHG